MALETLTLEIRVDYDDPAKLELTTQLLRQHAKALQASLMLLQDKRAPLIAIMGSNMFEREHQISLADDEENHTPGSWEGQI